MKLRTLLPLAALLALAHVASAAETGFKSIFNGKDLSGWAGLDFWSGQLQLGLRDETFVAVLVSSGEYFMALGH